MNSGMTSELSIDRPLIILTGGIAYGKYATEEITKRVQFIAPVTVYGGEDELLAAIREFEEETGLRPSGHFVFLTPRKQPGGKWIHAWALEGDFDIAGLTSSTFSLEWPPGSGSRQEFPEVDRAAWFDLDEARKRIIPGQAGFLDDLAGVVRV